jgi:hypothetical protein
MGVPVYSIKKNKGFAILTSVVLLSIAGITFTVNMVLTQLVDNQVVANYYRSNEAFANAESGINIMLSKIEKSKTVLDVLPIHYQPAGSYYTVSVEQLNKNTLLINSVGTSMDGIATRQIQVQIYYDLSYNIPPSAVAANGKLNLDETVTINDGCEGVSGEVCQSPGNIAEYHLVSHPKNETQVTPCTGEALGENVIAQDALYTSHDENNFLLIGEQPPVNNEFEIASGETLTWPNNHSENAQFHGVEAGSNITPSSLFESTFGITQEVANNVLQSASDVVTIDMTLSSGMSCSHQLNNIDQQVTTVYIKGDCDIEHSDTMSNTSGNDFFTLGSAEHPKAIFIEGGTFTTPINTDVSVTGMLYFLPSTQAVIDEHGNEQFVEDPSINLAGVQVNGALLSDYNCSHNTQDNIAAGNPSLSVRYDKAVLNTLYKNRGSIAIDSTYSLVEGSWKDFQ